MYLKEKPGRAWLEISTENLRANYKALCKLMGEECKCMAVVKADAYGHGAVRVAEVLSREGCDTFAVASLEEGIALRSADIRGKILVLGYTMPRDAFLLNRYDLTQTIVNETHANALAESGYEIKGHLAVDTGMNRLGIASEDIETIERVLNIQGLQIEGIYSHMSVADSKEEADRTFTEKQIAEFMMLKEKLIHKGYHNLLWHMQSSYGLLFYPLSGMHYARPGIALYGCPSNHPEEELGVALKPALSLKCRIGCIREVLPGEFVSYGRTFEAKEKCRVAVLAIGYADGFPRCLSDVGQVIVRGKKVPVVGRICMDQTIVNITEVPDACEGDVVTLIGKDGEEEITAAGLAAQAGTITNELLSRLGVRLTKTYVD